MFQEARRYLPLLQRAQLPKFIHYEVPDTARLSLLGTTLNLLNATTGPGLLALPLAFARCGWLLGTVLLLLVFALNHASLLLLLRACLATREHSYIGLCARCPHAVAALVDWASLAFFFGSSVSYLVLIGDAFGLLVTSLSERWDFHGGAQPMHLPMLAYVLLFGFTGLCLAPLSTLRSMDSLQITSTIGIVCLVFAVGVIASVPAAAPKGDGAKAAVMNGNTFLSLPTMTFCFSSQSLFPPALETLHQPATYEYVHQVVDVTMLATLALHLAVAYAGYLKIGGGVAPNVLDSLPQTAPVQLARAAVVLAFAFTFPMMIFLCRMHIHAILARVSLVDEQNDRPESNVAPARGAMDHTLVSLLLVGSSLLSAVCFPNIDAIFGLLGGTTAVVISFVAPAVFWEAFVGQMYPAAHYKRLFCKVLFGFSAVVAGLSLPSLCVDLLSDLYATAWWVPMASSAGMSSWSGGLHALADGELLHRPFVGNASRAVPHAGFA